MKKYSVIIIGGGPGGYVSAIRLKQFKIEVAVFEKERLGGVCLNHGCIPTKAMVKVAALFSEINRSENFGIEVQNPKINYLNIFIRKNEIVKKLVSGIEFIFKKRQIPIFNENVIQIEKIDNEYLIKTDRSEYSAKYIILATGSLPKQLPNLKFDSENILSSRDILQMTELPEKIVVVGGGVIGCEFASIFSRLGAAVEIVEFLPKLVFNEDEEISRRLAMALKKSGIKVHLKTSVESFEKEEKKLLVKLSNGKEILTDKILLSVGRNPVLDIKFKNCDMQTENGFIKISEAMRTNLESVFAIGDVTGKLMLAHTASKQGLIVADIINNETNNENNKITNLSYENIPRCTFTHPEIGSVGLTETQAKERFEDILIGKFPFSANGKALALGDTFGFVKVIADQKSKRLIGMHIIGLQATELIAQGSILLNTNADIDDVKKVVFAHPTLSESVMEALEDLEKLSVHKM